MTAADVVARGESAIKAPAGLAIAVIGIAGLIIAGIVRRETIAEAGSWRQLLPVIILFGSMAVAFLVAWAWHAVTVPRWWDWAVAANVDLDELISAATTAGLISAKESWWQERPSTLHARNRPTH